MEDPRLAIMSSGDDDEANMEIELPDEEGEPKILNFHVDDKDPYEEDPEEDEEESILEEFD